MRKLILFLLGTQLLVAQNYEANYEFIRAINGHVFNAKSKVISNGAHSIFKLGVYNNLLKKGTKLVNKEKSEGVINDTVVVGSSGYDTSEPRYYYTNYKEGERISLVYDRGKKTKSLIEEKLVHPKWKIENDLKVVNGYKCKKATAFIRDRIWTVYFTKQLRYKNINPWFFSGLSGVVVEAKEETGIYQFKLLSINKKI